MASTLNGHAALGRPLTFAPIRAQGRLQRIWGEISYLRRSAQTALFGSPLNTYRLDSTHVDYRLAKALYQNTDDRYKLGAGFARPIVNATAGFCGPPRFATDDDAVTQQLEEQFGRWRGTLLGINRDTLRDGDCFARLGQQEDPLGGPPYLDLWTVPPEWCEIIRDPVRRAWRAVLIHHPIEVRVERYPGTVEIVKSVLTETLTPDAILYRVPDDAPPEIQALVPPDRANEAGFIPLVHFKNEPEEGALYGVSDLEPVEPFMKAYHDVALHAIQGSQLFSRPKVKFKLKDVRQFLDNNFPGWKSGGTVNFAGKELFLLQQEDDAEFMTADQGLAGIAQLLELLFYCIIDVSETPEFAFGAGVESAKGSVAEQEIPLAKKIERKRGQLATPYADLARMYLVLSGTASAATRSDSIRVLWDEFSAKDEVNAATAIRTTVEACVQAINLGLLSLEAAADHLRTLIPTMLAWDTPDGQDEQARVQAGLAFLAQVNETLRPEPEPVAAGGRPQGRPPGPSSRPRAAGDSGQRRDTERNSAA